MNNDDDDDHRLPFQDIIRNKDDEDLEMSQVTQTQIPPPPMLELVDDPNLTEDERLRRQFHHLQKDDLLKALKLVTSEDTVNGKSFFSSYEQSTTKRK